MGIVGSKVELPEFMSFKEYIAGLLGVPIHGLIATHHDKAEGSNNDRETRHISRLMLTTPGVPLSIDSGKHPLNSIAFDDLSSSESSETDQSEYSNTSDSDDLSLSNVRREDDHDGNQMVEDSTSRPHEQAQKTAERKQRPGDFDYASLFEGIDTVGRRTTNTP